MKYKGGSERRLTWLILRYCPEISYREWETLLKVDGILTEIRTGYFWIDFQSRFTKSRSATITYSDSHMFYPVWKWVGRSTASTEKAQDRVLYPNVKKSQRKNLISYSKDSKNVFIYEICGMLLPVVNLAFFMLISYNISTEISMPLRSCKVLDEEFLCLSSCSFVWQ